MNYLQKYFNTGLCQTTLSSKKQIVGLHWQSVDCVWKLPDTCWAKSGHIHLHSDLLNLSTDYLRVRITYQGNWGWWSLPRVERHSPEFLLPALQGFIQFLDVSAGPRPSLTALKLARASVTQCATRCAPDWIGGLEHSRPFKVYTTLVGHRVMMIFLS